MSRNAIDAEELRRRIAAVPNWYHVMELAPGVETPGMFDMRPFVGEFGFPDSLAGRTVLDVGASNGFFSFHFEDLGAEQVIAHDLRTVTEHDVPRWYLEQRCEGKSAADIARIDHLELEAGFALAHEVFRSRAEKRRCHVNELGELMPREFDLTFCSNLFHHLRDPVAALESIRETLKPGGDPPHVSHGGFHRGRVEGAFRVRPDGSPRARRHHGCHPRSRAMTSASQLARKEENSRLLREDVAQRRTELRALPEVIGLHTTERCNLRCTMCVRSLHPSKVQLPRARLGAVCDRLFPTAKKAALSAAAGEPLLADFDLVLEKALAHGVRIDVVTNGTELTAEAYREAAPVLDHVNVSLDTAVPELYEEIRAGARFAKVAANLRGIAEERRRRPDDVLLSLSAVVMRSTLPHLADLVRFAGTVGADGVIFQRLHHSGKANPAEDPSEVPGPDAIREAFEEAGRAAREAGTNLALSEFGEDNVLVRPVREKVPPLLLDGGACWYVLQHFGVQPTGEVYPCCYPTDHLFGSVLDEDPVAIWNGRPARRLRAAHYSGRGTLFCAGCPHAPHLRPRRPAALVGWLCSARMRVAHTRNRWRRERMARIGTRS